MNDKNKAPEEARKEYALAVEETMILRIADEMEARGDVTAADVPRAYILDRRDGRI